MRLTNLQKLRFDLVVIGNGNAGLAAAKEASDLGAKVALINHPQAQAQTYYGVIPRKLIHAAVNVGQTLRDAQAYGWTNPDPIPNWMKLTNSIKNQSQYTKSKLLSELQERQVKILDAFAQFQSDTDILAKAKDLELLIQGSKFVVDLIPQPTVLLLEGKDLLTSVDQLFCLEKPPGKTVIIGSGVEGLENAGFLKALGYEVTVLVPFKVLPNLDQQMAKLLFDHLKEKGINFVFDAKPMSIVKQFDEKLLFSFKDKEKQIHSDLFDTVLVALGRRRNDLGVTGMLQKEKNKIFLFGEEEEIDSAFLDTLSGRLLAKRLFGGSTEEVDKKTVPKTIYTPLKYSFVGLNEEEGVSNLGEDNLEVYHHFYKPTVYSLPKRDTSQCYLKVLVDKKVDKVVGMHFIGPEAEEVIQGFAVAIRGGLTMEKLRNTVGIHPTVAEEFTRLSITKRSGKDPLPASCCS